MPGSARRNGAIALFAAAAVMVAAVLSVALAKREAAAGVLVFEARDGAIYTTSLDRPDLRRIVRYGSEPVWSPGGNRVAFVIHSPPMHVPPLDELWIVNADGTEPRRVARGSYLKNHTWSPDGAQIAFSRYTERFWAGAELSVVDLRSRRERVLAADLQQATLDWSPDGSEILASGRDLLAVDVGDGGLRMIARAVDCSAAVWSPDGERIAYAASKPRTFRGQAIELSSSVFVVDADGAGVRRLTRDFDLEPMWAPDGRSVVFTRGIGLPSAEPRARYSISLEGGKPRRLAPDDALRLSPALRPTVRPEAAPRLPIARLPLSSATVPDVLGMSYPEAARRLDEAGLEVTTNGVERRARAATVKTQRPSGGKRVPPGTVVDLLFDAPSGRDRPRVATEPSG